tara:strand:+ start:2746 stop:3720 length:975 start_codon:yes stop_codon:yes gene_type:complete
MISVTVIIITLVSYFHYNQLPIYDINLAFKFILNKQTNNDFDKISQTLGFESTDKLLIIHADDLGLCESVNSATFESFKNGSISSASVMMTTDEVNEVASFTNNNQNYDIGIHLTVTSEWKLHKWGGVLNNEDISSILNKKNHLYWNKRKFTKNGKLNEIRKELQAQIDLGKSMGFNPSHIDSHEGALFFDPDIFKLYLDLAKENNLLAFVPIQASVHFDQSFKKPKHAVIIDQFHMLPEGTNVDEIKDYYFNVVENLKPGLSQIIVHLGKDEEELREITIDHPNFDYRWRQLDFDVFNSRDFKDHLEKHNIKVINWEDLKKLI